MIPTPITDDERKWTEELAGTLLCMAEHFRKHGDAGPIDEHTAKLAAKRLLAYEARLAAMEKVPE